MRAGLVAKMPNSGSDRAVAMRARCSSIAADAVGLVEQGGGVRVWSGPGAQSGDQQRFGGVADGSAATAGEQIQGLVPQPEVRSGVSVGHGDGLSEVGVARRVSRAPERGGRREEGADRK